MDFYARLLKWADIEKWCSMLRDTIKENYSPDVIIGLSRGGLVPARLLSDSLLIKDLFVVKTEHWGITASMDGKTVIRDTGKLDVKGRKVLIVDDITDTGESMEAAVELIRSMDPAEVRSATMLHISHSKFVPDYYAENVSADQWTWFIFPWNVFEDLSNLSGKVLEREMTSSELLSGLREKFGLEIDLSTLENRLEHLAKIGKLSFSAGKWGRPAAE